MALSRAKARPEEVIESGDPAGASAPNRGGPDGSALKVCMVCGNFPPQIGGPATQSWHLCSELSRHGLDPFVVTFGDRSELEVREGIRVYRQRREFPGGALGKAARVTRFISGLVRVLRAERPHVIHCHDTSPASLLAGVVARSMGIPVVIKFAGDLVWEKVNARVVHTSSLHSAHRFNAPYRLVAGFQRWALQQFDLIWAASEFRRDNLVETVGLDPASVRVIPNYIRLAFPPDAVATERPSGPPFYVLSAGRFAAHKRLDRTLSAIAMLERPDVRLRLVGEGFPEEEAEVDRWIEKYGLADRVDRLGKVPYDELHHLMRTSHVLLSTSQEEGFGIVFVEAMAAGLPVLAMRIGAIPEVVPHGEAGFLLEDGNVAQIAEYLDLILSDADLRGELGAAGMARAKEYDLERKWTSFLDFYHEAIERRTKGRSA